MYDFAQARFNMVNSQVRTNKVTNSRLIEALETIPRELFVPAEMKTLACLDEDINIGHGRSLMEIMVFARMTQALMPLEQSEVLHVAFGLGYGSAVLGRCAKSVVAIETIQEFTDQAQTVLSEVGADNVVVEVVDDLKQGFPAAAPFDAILVEGAVSEIPTALSDQLREEGQIIALITNDETGSIGTGQARGTVSLFTNEKSGLSSIRLFDAACPLLGEFRQDRPFRFQD